MSLGMADRQGNLLDDVDRFLDEALDRASIYAFFHRERDALCPDEDFADLFDEKGRNSVPPSVVAVVMALQRLEGLSDLDPRVSGAPDPPGPQRPPTRCQPWSPRRSGRPRDACDQGSKDST